MSVPLSVSMAASSRRSSPFSRAGVLGILVVGAAAFLAMLYFLSVGDTGPDDSNNGQAHAAANGLNGFSALVELVKADGYSVTVSREQGKLETGDLLVLTPPSFTDPDELAQIIEDRQWAGPTLVILPKWNATVANQFFEAETPEKVKDGWVNLGGISIPSWAQAKNGPLALGLESGGLGANGAVNDALAADPQSATIGPKQSFATRYPLAELSGELPSGAGFFTKPNDAHDPLVVDQAGRTIAFSLEGEKYSATFEDDDGNPVARTDPSNWTVFVVEPDLMNNWGVADRTRALAAISIIRSMNYGDFDGVVFDLTLNGFGGAMNLLTLAFQPPFLAATLCLLLAMLIIGWRAFMRFGPAAVSAPGAAFGKARLVTNGADLIVRAGRLGLLAEPYIALTARQLARGLGLPKPDPAAIDAALAARHPGEASFSARAAELRRATKATDILRAARALNDQTSRI